MEEQQLNALEQVGAGASRSTFNSYDFEPCRAIIPTDWP